MSSSIPNSLLTLNLLPIASHHNDLEFTILGLFYRVDSYYLAIDDEYSSRWPNLFPPDFNRLAVTDLLTQWLRCVQSSKPGQTTFLPFGLDDERSQHLRVTTLPNDTLSLNVGQSSREGWNIAPSNLEGTSFESLDFTADLPTDIVVPRAMLIRDIQAAIATLNSTTT
jgi:hypothetical protein